MQRTRRPVRGGTVALVLLLSALALLFVPRLGSASAASLPLSTQIANQLAKAGTASGAYVLDTTTGKMLATVRADTPRIPASNEKLYTMSTALLKFGSSASLSTTVEGVGHSDDAGTWHGDLYLHGGGDPTFGSTSFIAKAYGAGDGADVTTLAKRLAATGIKKVTGAIYGDESWFDTLRGGPSSDYALDPPDLGGPLSALDFNRGLANEKGTALQAKPAKFAAQQLAAALKAAHVTTSGRVGQKAAPVSATKLASVDSPSIAQLVKLTLPPSDNWMAEMMVKDIGAKFGTSGSTSAGAAVVRSTISSHFGISPNVADGSGLSRSDATTPHQLVTLLAGMRDQTGFRTGLAVVGKTGTLATRMRGTSAASRCQGKSGTLSNVSALSGYCTTANNHLLAYSIIENSANVTRAHNAQDAIVEALAKLRPADTPLAPVTPTTPPGTPVLTPTTPSPTPTTGGAASASVRARH